MVRRIRHDSRAPSALHRRRAVPVALAAAAVLAAGCGEGTDPSGAAPRPADTSAGSTGGQAAATPAAGGTQGAPGGASGQSAPATAPSPPPVTPLPPKATRTARGIVFVRQVSDEQDPILLTIRPDGRGLRSLAVPVAMPAGPVFSPDGTHLAFTGGPAGRQRLYVMAAGGGNVRRVAGGAASGPTWSPDGVELAFATASGGRRSSIAIASAAAGNARRLTRGATDLQPSFAPDGARIAFLRVDPRTSAASLWTVHATGGGLRRLLGGNADLTEPVFAPGGAPRVLVFDRRRLLLADLASGSRRVLVTLARDAAGGTADPAPAWSPDGRFIVFSQERQGTIGRQDLWTVRSDGRGLHRLTDSPGVDTDPTWGR